MKKVINYLEARKKDIETQINSLPEDVDSHIIQLVAEDMEELRQIDAAIVILKANSAYYVHIAGQGETCVVAQNIADAMDKIEKLTEANYTFILNRSIPLII